MPQYQRPKRRPSSVVSFQKEEYQALGAGTAAALGAPPRRLMAEAVGATRRRPASAARGASDALGAWRALAPAMQPSVTRTAERDNILAWGILGRGRYSFSQPHGSMESAIPYPYLEPLPFLFQGRVSKSSENGSKYRSGIPHPRNSPPSQIFVAQLHRFETVRSEYFKASQPDRYLS